MEVMSRACGGPRFGAMEDSGYLMHDPTMVEENNTGIPPQIAVIISVYKQGHLLKDAVLSVVNQSIADRVKVIIVNDGCPRESTDRMGRYFSEMFRGKVFYLRKSNGGLSSARNYGVRFALNAWPSVEAIFPLDADNRFSPLTLEKLWEKLSTSEPDVGWVYQDLTFFGAEHGVWDMSVPFSLYRLLHGSCYDAASLIRRSVFESGCWYDEQMKQAKQGYADWEFYIQAGLKGFRGVHVPDTGFLYRQRGYSMLSGTQKIHDLIYGYIRNKHSDRFDTNQINALEHLEMPRFALITPESQRVSYFTNPNAEPSSQPLLSDFLNDLAARVEGPSCGAPYVPPFLLFARKDIFALLRNLRLLPGMLIDFQMRLLRFECVSVTVELADGPDVISMEPGAPTKKADLVCLGAFKFLELTQAGKEGLEELLSRDALPSKYNLRVRIGRSFLGERYHYLTREILNEHDYTLGTKIITVGNRCSHIIKSEDIKRVDHQAKWLIPDHTHYASWKHLQCEETTLPYHVEPKPSSKPINIFLLLDLCDIGGVKEIVLNLGKNLPSLNSSYRVHLLVTDANTMRLDGDCFKRFETVSFLLSDRPESDRERLLLNILSVADIVVNNHSLIGYRLSEQIKDKYQTKIISHLQVVDLDPQNLPCGFPVIASRGYEPLIDCFWVPSRNLKRYCMNLDVPEEKIVLLPNAPTASPLSTEWGLSIMDDKCKRTYSANRPVKILFTGRFDRQKGIHRIRSVAARLEELGLRAQFLLVGKHVLESDETPEPTSNLKVLPPTSDKRLLCQYYSDADIFLLLSRWEGVPLTILEAMTFGNVVIATDVGGVSEIVEHGNTGFLVDPTQPEDLLIEEVCSIILDIIQNPRKYDQLRMNAFSRAMDFSWAKSARILSGVIDSLIAAGGGV